MKILVVDDEQDICEILQYNLGNEGYDVDIAYSAEEALMLPLVDYALILLDVMMGEMSGFQMAKRLKDSADTANIPIIFITALDNEDDTALGLDIGADDYIAKPLSMKEVKARVKAVLRRSGLSADKPICMNHDSKTATLDGKDLLLTKLEFELLSLFLQNPDRVFSREELLKRCWPQNVYVLDRTVDVSIARLRKKLGRYGCRIKSRIGYGYVFDS